MEKKTELAKKGLALLNKNKTVTVVYKNTLTITTSNKKMLQKIISRDYDEIEYIR